MGDKAKFEVASKKCKTCIFSANTPISKARFQQHINSILANDSYAVCHTAQIQQGDDSKVCCRGFFDAYGNDSLITRVAKMCKVVEEVELK